MTKIDAGTNALENATKREAVINRIFDAPRAFVLDRSEAHGAVVGSEGLHKPDQTRPRAEGAWRCIHKRFCKVPTLWRRLRAARLSRPASIDDLRRYIELLF